MPYYLDTSALVKLVVAEAEPAALLAWLGNDERVPVSSDLTRTELIRAVRRAAPERMVEARAVLDALTLLELTPAVFEQVGRLDLAIVHSLDAIHLAAALALGDDLEGFVAYDGRRAEAARANGVAVVAPT